MAKGEASEDKGFDWWDEIVIKGNLPDQPKRAPPRRLQMPPPKEQLNNNRMLRKFTGEMISFGAMDGELFPRESPKTLDEGTTDALKTLGRNKENAFLRGLDVDSKTGDESARKRAVAKSKGAKQFRQEAQISLFDDMVDIHRTESGFMQGVLGAEDLFFSAYGRKNRITRQVLTAANVNVGKRKCGQWRKRNDGKVEGEVAGLLEYKSFSIKRYSESRKLFELTCLALAWTISIENEIKTAQIFKKEVYSKLPYGAVRIKLDGLFAIIFSDGIVTNENFSLTQEEVNLCQEDTNDWLIDRLTLS